ncbi:MAG: alpha/beta fold hydrolase [Promethearchaeota archaeon]
MANKNPPKIGFAEVGGGRIYYEILGKGHPLVLIHSGITDSRMWDDQFPVFAKHFQVVRYDVRGFGKTRMPENEFTLHSDLCDLLHELGIRKTHLLGCSMGGYTAINFALEYPEMVSGLVLVGSGLGGFEMKDKTVIDQWKKIDELIEQKEYSQAADLEIDLWVAGPQRSLEEMGEPLRNRIREMLIPSYSIPSGELKELDPAAFDRLDEIKAPTLVLVGELDALGMLDTADILANKIQGAKKLVMSGVAHLPNMEAPKEFSKIVLDFLTSL